VSAKLVATVDWATEGRFDTGAANPSNSLAWGVAGTTDCRSLRGSTHSRLFALQPPFLVPAKELGMRILCRSCAGLDVHKKTVVACRRVITEDGELRTEVRSFGTTTPDLRALREWLREADVTHVAMESTGVYWHPIWNVLEEHFTLLLVNAQHIKQVPGRKTDVKDAEWIAELLQHGLLKASFVPERSQRELRELTRYRTVLVQERTAEVNRLQKTLEGANIKLASVASDVTGKSAREMLAALLAGADDPAALAELARGRMREKLPQLEQALTGQFGAHQRFLVARQLAHLDHLDTLIAELDDEIAARLRPFDPEIERLDEITGVGRRTVEAMLAETGTSLEQFPTDQHLAKWAGMCPGNNETGGKRKSGKTRKGNRWLRSALVQAAHAAGRARGTFLGAQYRRLTARRGKKRAAVAVGHRILVIFYHMVTKGTEYHELGANYYDERDRERVIQRLVHRLEGFGCKVTLEQQLAPAA
jgi:transposase